MRYKQTAFGAAWAVGQPLVGMLIFTILFGRLADIDTGATPYALFAYSGLVLWNFFSNAVSNAATSLVANVHLVSKIYFPRFALPTASALSYVVDLAISSALLIVLLVLYGEPIRPRIVFVPIFAGLVLIAALGISYFLAALAARYRDVKFALPFIVQIWFFASPIVYPASLFADWSALYALNPIVGAVEGFRWAALGTAFPGQELAVSTAVTLVLLVGGAYYFRQVERVFADVI